MKVPTSTPLGGLVTVLGGGTPTRNNSDFFGGDIPWVTPKDMKSWEIHRAEMTLTRLGLESSAARIIPENSVLIVVRSGVLKHTLPVGLNRVPVAINQDMKALMCQPHVNPDFLAHYLKACSPHILRWVRATTADNFPIDKLKAMPVPIFTPKEQSRIAALLDSTESLRAKRRATIASLGLLSQSVFSETFGNSDLNATSWKQGVLGDVASFVGGGTPSRERPEYFSGSTCWATSKDMKSEYLDDTQEHITKEAIRDSATKLVPVGTVLVVVKSKILAHHLPVAVTRVPTCFGQDLKGIHVNECCDPLFIATAIRVGKRFLLGRARGINTEGLTLEHLKAFPLPLPPLAVQREFARQVAAIDKLKAAHRAHLAQLDALFASLQHRAFRGEL